MAINLFSICLFIIIVFFKIWFPYLKRYKNFNNFQCNVKIILHSCVYVNFIITVKIANYGKISTRFYLNDATLH